MPVLSVSVSIPALSPSIVFDPSADMGGNGLTVCVFAPRQWLVLLDLQRPIACAWSG